MKMINIVDFIQVGTYKTIPVKCRDEKTFCC